MMRSWERIMHIQKLYGFGPAPPLTEFQESLRDADVFDYEIPHLYLREAKERRNVRQP
jgi:hypothetical protein